MGRDCPSERVPIAQAEGRPVDPRAKASAEIAHVDPYRLRDDERPP